MRPKFYTSTDSLFRFIVIFLLKHKPKFVYRTLVISLFFFNASNAQDVLMGLASNGGPSGKGIAFSIKSTGTDFNIIQPFADWGKNPNSLLLSGPDGSYYGTTTNGGVYGYGSIYKMSPSGVITLIKSFNLSVDGGYPYGRLTLAKDGNFYGTTSGGGPNSAGVIYRLTTAGVYTVVRSLSGPADGSNPRGHLVAGKDGNLYGITYGGGTYGTGTIFRLTTAGVYTVLKSLNKPTDGGNSYGSLVQGSDGNLYGMTYWGGTYNYGTIFKYSFTAGYSVLRHINAVADGSYTSGTLIEGTDAKLYGMMYSGGTYGNGTIFSISTSGAFTILRHLRSGTDGSYPVGALVEYTDGALYGVLPSGGANGGGTAFKITKAKVFTVLRPLTPKTDGSAPKAGLTIGADGALYGCASDQGPNLFGSIFRLSGTTFTLLNTFTGATLGNNPSGDLFKADDNALYGTTTYGGTYNYGTIFKICGGKTTVLKSFNRNADGGLPKGSLVQAADGNLYGLTSDGGLNSNGTIFRISKTGVFAVVRHLKGATDGGFPNGSLLLAKDGFLYGLTSSGGTTGAGVMFKISTAGVFSVIRNFTAATDGSNPQGSLTQHPDGTIYGMTSNNGRIFKLTSAGVFSIVKTFSSAADGNSPTGRMVVGVDNSLYGTTSSGGTYGKGTIFKLTTAGVYSVLKHFNATTDGQYPKGGLVQGTDGHFYGMTSTGGTLKGGTLFRITIAKVFTVVKNFDLIKDGGSPLGGLLKYTGVVLVANPQTVSTTEDLAKAITLTGSGAAGLIYNVTIPPINGKITGTAPAITYTPTLNFSGRDSFYFTVSVGCQTSAPAKVIVTTTAVNDAPVLATIGSKSIVKGTALKFTASATDPDPGQTLAFSLITPPSGATISATTGAFSWTPATAGTFSVKVRVTDNGSPVKYDEEIVTITVSASLVAGISAPGEDQVEAITKENIQETSKTTVFPNPAHEKLFIRFSEQTEKTDIRVMDIKGMVISNVNVKRISGNQVELGVSALKAGTYIVNIQTDKGTETLRFIRN